MRAATYFHVTTDDDENQCAAMQLEHFFWV